MQGLRFELTSHFLFCILAPLLLWSPLTAQESSKRILSFELEPKSTYLDSTFQKTYPSWRKEDKTILLNHVFTLLSSGSNLSVKTNFTQDYSRKDLKKLDFVAIQNRDTTYLAYKISGLQQARFSIDSLTESTEVLIFKEDSLLGSITIDVVETRKEKAYIVPLIEKKLDENAVQKAVNALLKPYYLSFDFEFVPSFYSSHLKGDSVLNNPVFGFDHYSVQMRQIRDDYFRAFPNFDRKAYYVFLHAGFVNDSLPGYSAKGKAISFVKYDGVELMSTALARELLRGIGSLDGDRDFPEREIYQNIFKAPLGTALNPRQWRKIHIEYKRYSYYDDDEELHSLNGFVAYYFWEEDENGFIRFRPSDFKRVVQRPYKKNYLSYHFSIEKRIFKPLFRISHWIFAPIHFFSMLLFLVLGFWIFRKKFLENYFHRVGIKMARKLSKFVIISLVSLFMVLSSVFLNKIMSTYVIFDGIIPDFENLTIADVRQNILHDADIERTLFPEMASEVLIKRGSSWVVKRRKRVLYFDLYKDSAGFYTKARFNRENDSIILPALGVQMLAPSHYFVLNYIDSGGSYEQKLFNYKGKNVTKLLQKKNDPAKRILLFVNGYRPTSLGNTLEENFGDILAQGIEYPDSRNLIDTFDINNYWTPWKEINKQFIKRINPSQSYYADGHFSVATSNYRSLIHFTQVSSTYPERCKNPEKHTCKGKGGTTWFKSSRDRTELLLPTRPNYEGFEKRRSNGRIAGMNLYQELNEIPNDPSNDTLYIICHSMGYAYALGMIEELRGKINFGSLYIIAPENASAGEVNPEEWNEVWQYGVNHLVLKKNAPCMLDGVAPQVRAAGLEPKHQIFIPENLYRRFGFFDSHFIGYYDWILNIPKGKRGYMRQN